MEIKIGAWYMEKGTEKPVCVREYFKHKVFVGGGVMYHQDEFIANFEPMGGDDNGIADTLNPSDAAATVGGEQPANSCSISIPG